jgi:hypothetical protein
MDKKTEQEPASSSIVRLHPAGLISLLTFLTAFPAGYILMIINWRRIGKREKERSYVFGLVSSSLLIILLQPFYGQAGCGISIINIAFGIYFYNEMISAMNAYEQTGNSFAKENFFAGCLIGLLAIGIWFVVAAILIGILNFFISLL